jgi:hypothetical protein
MLTKRRPSRRDAERWLNEPRKSFEIGRKSGFTFGAMRSRIALFVARERDIMSTMKTSLLCAVAVSGFAMLAAAQPAQALTTQECSAKYQAAKTAGTLNGQKWNDFRKAQCGADATAATPTMAPAPAPAPAPTAPKSAETKPTAAPAMPAGNAVYPSVVDPKYAKESAGKARMHTCVDQYNANKASGGNGGMKWIEKGGGYYSACNTKLKGA